MLLAIVRWRSERSSSARAWKSNVPVNLSNMGVTSCNGPAPRQDGGTGGARNCGIASWPRSRDEGHVWRAVRAFVAGLGAYSCGCPFTLAGGVAMSFARGLCRGGLALLAALSAPAWAQYEQSSQAWAEQMLAQLPPDVKGPLRMEVSVGNLDSRLKLAPCGQVEPYLPPNTRLWGRSRLGLRCVDGVTRWGVFLPVRVKAFGRGWVRRGPVAQGAVLTADD